MGKIVRTNLTETMNQLQEELREGVVVVTGANGFIGSAFVWQLNQVGVHKIIAVDSVPLSERNLLKYLKIEKFLLKDELLNYLPQAKNVRWIIHMGACSSTTETNMEFLLENNTQYTQKLFEWSAKNRVDFIYASSAATYGDGALGFDDATDAELLKPLNLYGESKVLFDRWALKSHTRPKHWYGLKFFNVFGPMEYHKQSMSSVVYKSFHSIKSTGQVQLFKSHRPDYKDGEQVRDFVYIKDVTYWMLELMLNKPSNGIYNMGFGKARSWKDLASSVFKSMKKPMKIEWIDIPENIRNQYQYFTESNMKRFLELGMTPPQWSLEDGIMDYVTNYLNHQDAFLGEEEKN